MILLLGILAGLLAGLARMALSGRRLDPPALRGLWLVPVAYLPQWLAFQLAPTRQAIPDEIAAVALVASQAGLLLFAGLNLRRPSFWLLGLGLALNLAVIAFNGGLMPISPETVARLLPEASPGAWQIGERLGSSKDVVLPMREMHLWWLSDRFLLLGWFSYRVAFSLGDVLIALGTGLFFWSISSPAGKTSRAVQGPWQVARFEDTN